MVQKKDDNVDKFFLKKWGLDKDEVYRLFNEFNEPLSEKDKKNVYAVVCTDFVGGQGLNEQELHPCFCKILMRNLGNVIETSSTYIYKYKEKKVHSMKPNAPCHLLNLWLYLYVFKSRIDEQNINYVFTAITELNKVFKLMDYEKCIYENTFTVNTSEDGSSIFSDINKWLMRNETENKMSKIKAGTACNEGSRSNDQKHSEVPQRIPENINSKVQNKVQEVVKEIKKLEEIFKAGDQDDDLGEYEETDEGEIEEEPEAAGLQPPEEEDEKLSPPPTTAVSEENEEEKKDGAAEEPKHTEEAARGSGGALGSGGATPRPSTPSPAKLTSNIDLPTSYLPLIPSVTGILVMSYFLWKYFGMLRKTRKRYRRALQMRGPSLEQQIVDDVDEDGQREYCIVKERKPRSMPKYRRKKRGVNRRAGRRRSGVRRRMIIDIHLEVLNECQKGDLHSTKEDFFEILVQEFMASEFIKEENVPKESVAEEQVPSSNSAFREEDFVPKENVPCSDSGF
ncbi:SICA antigen [Plasmodium coatneyi]|uniref:SICA antigen n=1 Tax=Plasmodium coatneyi TaxID=208452 RepID=A0A1B1E644_9APIC|nr:SICA antigen [Plasmodium coatneyi]ANQ10458.1 SICA antigen [Plasmodium coatneyi]